MIKCENMFLWSQNIASVGLVNQLWVKKWQGLNYPITTIQQIQKKIYIVSLLYLIQ